MNKSVSKRTIRAELNAEGRARKQEKKHRGNPAGSRINVEQVGKAKKTGFDKKIDPRIGSKVPIILTNHQLKKEIMPTKKQEQIDEEVKLSPEAELDKLETDIRLDALLARLDVGETLAESDQKYVDITLDRIDELMELLGIIADDESEQQEDIVHLLKQK